MKRLITIFLANTTLLLGNASAQQNSVLQTELTERGQVTMHGQPQAFVVFPQATNPTPNESKPVFTFSDSVAVEPQITSRERDDRDVERSNQKIKTPQAIKTLVLRSQQNLQRTDWPSPETLSEADREQALQARSATPVVDSQAALAFQVPAQKQIETKVIQLKSEPSREVVSTLSDPNFIAAGSEFTTLPMTDAALANPFTDVPPRLVKLRSAESQQSLAIESSAEKPAFDLLPTEDSRNVASAHYSDMSFDESDLATLPSHAASAVDVTRPRFEKRKNRSLKHAAVSPAITTPKTASSNTRRRRFKRQDKRKAAATTWGYLPLLLLPFLGCLIWRLTSGRRNQEEGITVAETTVKQSPTVETDDSVIVAIREEVSLDGSRVIATETIDAGAAETSPSREPMVATNPTTERPEATSAMTDSVARECETVDLDDEAETSTQDVSRTNVETDSKTSDIVPTTTGGALTRTALTCSDRQETRTQNDSSVTVSSKGRSNSRDDLTKIDGIEPATAKLLRASGVPTYRSLYETDSDRLRTILRGGGANFQSVAPIGWREQSRFAMHADWDGLSKWQSTNRVATEGQSEQSDISRSAETPDTQPGQTTSASENFQSYDDLTKISCIGAATAKLLRASGVPNYRSLYETDPDRIRTILRGGGSDFQSVDPRTWRVQARLAMRGDWNGLAKWQAATGANTVTAESRPEQFDVSRSTETSAPPSDPVQETSANVNSDSSDDLTRINGIGSATAKLLRASGITSFRSLHETDTEHLRTVLRSGGAKFQLVNPHDWREQSRFAVGGDWSGLANWQAVHGVTTEKASSREVARRSQPGVVKEYITADADDLTKIHGLGPASQKVLNENGIWLFTQIASMTSQEIEKLFAKTPKRFKLLNTQTWQTQAQNFSAPISKQEQCEHDHELGLLDEIGSLRALAANGKKMAPEAPLQEKKN